ncbi:MAG: UbiA family prenyltransferase [Pirellulales bacterium]
MGATGSDRPLAASSAAVHGAEQGGEPAATVARPSLAEHAPHRRPYGRAVLRALRPHHWLKNLLVFAPAVFGHMLSDIPTLVASSLAFVTFCLAASAIYLFNDMLDVESDRRHPIKRYRPLAAGELTFRDATLICGLLLLSSAILSIALLPPLYSLVLACYAVANVAYSSWLKRKVMVDIVLLAGLYTLRIIAGGAATGIVPSEWLSALSLFLFLSLAFLKRFVELSRLRDEGIVRTDNRGYQMVDLELLQVMGPACGLLAVLVLALYINSQQVLGLYEHPRVLWLVCPLLLYWIGRTWIWARRGAITEDPLSFALRDRTSWIVLACVVALGFLAI